MARQTERAERLPAPPAPDNVTARRRINVTPPGGAAELLALQTSMGNKAVSALLARGQAKLAVGPAGDRFEQEADQVAARVVAHLQSSAPTVDDEERASRVLASGPARISRAVVGAAGGDLDASTESLIQQARTGGEPLARPVRQQMETAFGADFGAVRVHSAGNSAALNDSSQAKAFTVGSDIFFRDGTPDASSRGGQELLAHELTHTIQQGAARLHDPEPGF